MIDHNACGNRHIDGLAMRGRMQSIWDRLIYLHPGLRPLEERIWLARRSGAIRRIIEQDPAYAVLLESQTTGPRNKREWKLLARAASEAAGKGGSP